MKIPTLKLKCLKKGQTPKILNNVRRVPIILFVPQTHFLSLIFLKTFKKLQTQPSCQDIK